MKNLKKIFVLLLLAAIICIYPISNAIALARSGNETSAADTKSGTAVLESIADYDVKKAETNVRTAKEKREDPTGNAKKVAAVLKSLQQGKTTYRKVLSDVYIVGDSLMKGLESYDILNSNHLIAQVSASLYHLKEHVPDIIKINPPVLIIHYGINMISTESSQLKTFISMYTGIIKQLKKALPETRIVISGLFPVNAQVATAKRFTMVSAYNKSLKAMCKELQVEFLDSSSVLKAHPECYGGDGIHLSKAFYEKYWLRYIIQKLEIV